MRQRNNRDINRLNGLIRTINSIDGELHQVAELYRLMLVKIRHSQEYLDS